MFSLFYLQQQACVTVICSVMHFKGKWFFITTILQWMKDRGCFFLASPPCTGMSAGAYWTVAAAFWPTSWPSTLQRLPFYSTTSVVVLHKCERHCACCTFNYSLDWNGVPWIRNLLPAAFPQHCIFIWVCTVLTQLELSGAASSTSPCLEERWTWVLEYFDCVFVKFASQTKALI